MRPNFHEAPWHMRRRSTLAAPVAYWEGRCRCSAKAWPDSSRYEDHRATYEYHFMNVVVADADEMVMERDCANYDCVQLAIVRYANYLSMDPGGSGSLQTRRANALKRGQRFNLDFGAKCNYDSGIPK